MSFYCVALKGLNLWAFHREDDKDGMKFYTDPDYFFQLWRQEMLEVTERRMNDKVKKVREVVDLLLRKMKEYLFICF